MVGTCSLSVPESWQLKTIIFHRYSIDIPELASESSIEPDLFHGSQVSTQDWWNHHAVGAEPGRQIEHHFHGVLYQSTNNDISIVYSDMYLVGGLEHFLFCHVLGIIIPTDELIFFIGVETTNQVIYDSEMS